MRFARQSTRNYATSLLSIRWISFPDERVAVCGLPWFNENKPKLWRFPEREIVRLPPGVCRLMRFPSGGRLCFACNTSNLIIRLSAFEIQNLQNMSAYGGRGLDLYIDDIYWSSLCINEPGEQEKPFFQNAPGGTKEITIYLPTYQEVQVLAVGVDEKSKVLPTKKLQEDPPIVFYGSSIAQGGGACRPAMTYEAVLARQLNRNFINLGFGGSGRGEEEVIELIARIDACCYIFDLGKSYGWQPAEIYDTMLAMIRSSHPCVPLVCITPIYSTREFYDEQFTQLSAYTREMARKAALKRINGGDERVYLIEGCDLLGPQDTEAFHDGTHPNDIGYQRIAERLRMRLDEILLEPIRDPR